MAMWFKLSPVTSDAFFDTAPVRFRYEMHLNASADEVWAGLVADRPLAWCSMLDGHYTSARPFAAGTTREVTAGHLLMLRERFFIWDEEGRHHAFYVEESNIPAFDQFAEDYQVTPTATGCIFVWRFAFKGRPGLGTTVRLTSPVAKIALLDGFIRDTIRRFGGRLN